MITGNSNWFIALFARLVIGQGYYARSSYGGDFTLVKSFDVTNLRVCYPADAEPQFLEKLNSAIGWRQTVGDHSQSMLVAICESITTDYKLRNLTVGHLTRNDCMQIKRPSHGTKKQGPLPNSTL